MISSTCHRPSIHTDNTRTFNQYSAIDIIRIKRCQKKSIKMSNLQMISIHLISWCELSTITGLGTFQWHINLYYQRLHCQPNQFRIKKKLIMFYHQIKSVYFGKLHQRIYMYSQVALWKQ